MAIWEALPAELESHGLEPFALNDPDEDHYDGYDQQQVNESAYGVG